MDDKYFAKKIEKKWQDIWAASKAFEAEADPDNKKPKFYALEMLPYPSGNLHMGHVRNYSAGDALAWYKRLKGFNVLHPIGWDSFGQPAEDAAVKRGVDPREWTEKNIEAMRGQLERLGLSYDWRRQIYAHRPEYYKFDQWFFLKLYEMGLAYKRMTQVNWCETEKATLSNEQASGGLCWRCGNPVVKKDLEQWFLRTTAYTSELLEGMAAIESGWPQNVLKRQQDWIGRSDGAYVDFAVCGSDAKIRVFTTRIDTIYGTNAIVVAPQHEIVAENCASFDAATSAKIDEMIQESLKPKERDEVIEKDGVDTGLRAINPFSGDEVPVWVGNYVMMEYGTGALMSVPGHDERDHEFAVQFGLPITQVIAPLDADGDAVTLPFCEYGEVVNSGDWNGKPSTDAKREMAAFAASNGFGEPATTYRLRDWGISRQRFWGSPIPMIYCDKCGVVPEKFENLPVRLPDSAPITGTGESPLAKVPEFYETSCPSCDGPARRETDTMDTFVDSSWYYYRYLDPANEIMPFDPFAAAYWAPVDQYIGGDDHAVMHLIYARFWTKALRDMGLLQFDEPFTRLLTQGMVVGETFFDDSTGKRAYFAPEKVAVERDEKGRIVSATADGTALKFAIERMSKSKGNGVDPDEMVEIYGADATRLFVMFAAPIENELVWNEAAIEGAARFIQRIWRQTRAWVEFLDVHEAPSEASSSAARGLRRKTHQTIKRVGASLESLQFNTPVAALMELSNAVGDIKAEPSEADAEIRFAVREALTSLVLMLTPFSPHVAEELYSHLMASDAGMVASGARFPEFSEELAREDEIEIAVQVNGKLRSRVFAAPDASRETLEQLALADGRTQEFVAGQPIKKVVVVPGRLVNIVV
ncbi:MAG: leucyl-tRNA synthetase [Acidobacteria bacterium OLB17]|nr:MAG: leucyl-tRNA synthetase [Acidobacteria bacterium OLB17]MCZ2390070.1 leucine--tRNA ligase [Acidobacteriota bacterium]